LFEDNADQSEVPFQKRLKAELNRCLALKIDARTRPVFAALSIAYVQRIQSLLDGGGSVQLVTELDELRGWLSPKRAFWTEASDGEAGNEIVQRGYSYSGAKKIIDRAKKLRSGRPSDTRRLTAINALESHLTDHSQTWPRLAKQFCNGEHVGDKHKESCELNLKKCVAELRCVLKKYGFKFQRRDT
jgi:hypothetical protein